MQRTNDAQQTEEDGIGQVANSEATDEDFREIVIEDDEGVSEETEEPRYFDGKWHFNYAAWVRK